MITLKTSGLISLPVRNIKARVELYSGDTLAATYRDTDNLISFTLERTGSGKFYGYGVGQKINIKLMGVDKKLITTSNSFKVVYTIGTEDINPLPDFYVTEVHKDENNGQLSITAYDALYTAASMTIPELPNFRYSLLELAQTFAQQLNLSVITKTTGTQFNLGYHPEKININGDETIRELLDDIAEVSQTIYYIQNKNIIFRRLDEEKEDLKVTKEDYFTLNTRLNRRLVKICSVTELGDNLEVSIAQSGSTYYMRNNCLWDIRKDRAKLLQESIETIGGFTIGQYSLDWRGNPLIEIGDNLGLVNKDDTQTTGFLINETVEYNGSLSSKASWIYEEEEKEAGNPTTIGEKISQTSAKVDKVNKRIDLEVTDIKKDVEQNEKNISSLTVTSGEISASVTSVSKQLKDTAAATDNRITDIEKSVTTKVDADSVQIAINKSLEGGVKSVNTGTGFTFDEKGLSINKKDSEINTTISENGMVVKHKTKAMLTANNTGVDAENLHATTFLIIGKNSRLEDYGSNRTGCFWIGR